MMVLLLPLLLPAPALLLALFLWKPVQQQRLEQQLRPSAAVPVVLIACRMGLGT